MMKKINIGFGIVLLTLVGCSALDKQSEEERILLPTVTSKAHDIKISTMIEGEFIPQTDIIHIGQNVSQVETGITEVKLNGIDQVNIGYKQVRNGLAYNGKSATPFTGTFVTLVGVHKLYTEDYKAGKLNGYKMWYSEAGRTGMKEPYVNGVKNGIQETYFRNTGNIRSRVNYVGGRISGEVEWYNNNGGIISKEYLKNGTGPWISYWDNGKVKEKGNLLGGLPNGEWRNFTQKGELEKLTIYKSGSPISQEWMK
ncbi:hypothetical protein [uncultured Cetobacterium sp.]|uniref:toxin-antitoxin system YwqK family antitoxin n=1 Tax=uncultured Cetobacterium sp. TaxID=527638 RepID=UPI00261409BF|nr:hypothetical protein [uncultured Cetobacterium sp.]